MISVQFFIIHYILSTTLTNCIFSFVIFFKIIKQTFLSFIQWIVICFY